MTPATRLVAKMAVWALLATVVFGGPTHAYLPKTWVALMPNGKTAPPPKPRYPPLRFVVDTNGNSAVVDENVKRLFLPTLRHTSITELQPVALVLNPPGEFERAEQYLSGKQVGRSHTAAIDPPAWVVPLIDEPRNPNPRGYTSDQFADMSVIIPSDDMLRVSNLENYRRALEDFARNRHRGWFGWWRDRYGADNLDTADVRVKPVLFIPHLPQTEAPLEGRVLMQRTTGNKVDLLFSEPLAQHFQLKLLQPPDWAELQWPAWD